MTRVYLSIGTNINRVFHLCACLDRLHRDFGDLLMSSVYESEAVGFVGDPFYNMVVGIDTDHSVVELSQILKNLEDEHGRNREGPRFSSRTLDIDILTYGDYCDDLNSMDADDSADRIKLPRGEITQNAFVLKPLAEIAPLSKHPSLGLSYEELWTNYDQDKQKLWPVDFTWCGKKISFS